MGRGVRAIERKRGVIIQGWIIALFITTVDRKRRGVIIQKLDYVEEVYQWSVDNRSIITLDITTKDSRERYSSYHRRLHYNADH